MNKETNCWSHFSMISLCLFLLLGALSAEKTKTESENLNFGQFSLLPDARRSSPDLPAGLLAAAQWRSPEATYLCTVYKFPATDEDVLPLRVLVFCEADFADKQWQYETPDAFVSMFPLTDDSDAFMTIWTGGSAYHCVIFAITAGEPHVSLEFGTLSPPEIVYAPDGQPCIIGRRHSEKNGVADITYYRRNEEGEFACAGTADYAYRYDVLDEIMNACGQ